jgi:hypothetical protein
MNGKERMAKLIGEKISLKNVQQLPPIQLQWRHTAKEEEERHKVAYILHTKALKAGLQEDLEKQCFLMDKGINGDST